MDRDIHKDIENYEKRKETIRKRMAHFNKLCKSHFGEKNKYVSPTKNPYKEYADANDYDAKILNKGSANSISDEAHYKNRKVCKFLSGADTEPDKANRYYKYITEKKECDMVNGTWDDKAISRVNKYDIGVCWKTDEDKVCSDKTTGLLLRPHRVKFTDVSKDIVQQSDSCKRTDGCKWQKLSNYTYDCVKSDSADAIEDEPDGPVMNPPKDLNVENAEDYFKQWYSGKKGKAPETSELIGEGNRCKGVVIEDESIPTPKPDSKWQIQPYINYRGLDPKKKEDAIILKKAMNNNDVHFKKFTSEYTMIKQYGYEKFIDRYKNKSFADNFYNQMDKIQFETDGDIKKTVDPKKKKPTKAFLPSIPQSIANMVMKKVAKGESDRRGMLLWHSVGSGKTCSAAGVMESFWDTNRPIIFASSIDAIAANPDYKFHECLLNLFPRFQQGEFKGRNNAESMALIAAAFKRRNIKFLSFAKLSNRVVKAIEYKKTNKMKGGAVEKSHADILNGEGYVDLENAVLIIDEVHNLFRPLANQQKEHKLLENEILDPRKHPNLKIVILTGTPGDNIPDILKLINIIRRPTDPEIKTPNINDQNSLKNFKKEIRGMVSFFDMSNDNTKFPKTQDSVDFIRTPMSQIQFAKYVEAYKGLTAEKKDFAKLAKGNKTGKYYEAARKYSNAIFNFDKDMALSDFSCKLPYLLENIQKYPKEKQYVYSAFYAKRGYGEGVIAMSKELNKLGYVNLTVAEAKKLNKAGKLPPKGVKRYILVISTELGGSGDGETGHNLGELLKIYNHPENKHGELIHLMLASQKYNESLDLKDVKHLHVYEPLVTMASDKQLIGRAVRFCSFANLPHNEWIVKVHRYIAEKPDTAVIAKGNNEDAKLRLASEIADLEEKLSKLGSKDDVKEAKTLLKVQQKELAKTEKLLAKGKATIDEVAKLKTVVGELEKTLATKEQALAEAKVSGVDMKNMLKTKQKDLQKFSAAPKIVNNENAELIEEKIFKESRERMKELLTVYTAMKQAAIDCRALNEFHNKTSDEKIVCENF